MLNLIIGKKNHFTYNRIYLYVFMYCSLMGKNAFWAK